MVMHAKLNSSLTEDRLYSNFNPKTANTIKGHNGGRYLLFNHVGCKPSFFAKKKDFEEATGSSLDLSTGNMHVGGVQFEASVAEIIGGYWENGQFRSTIDLYSGAVSNTPLAFAFERLFNGEIGPLEIIEMYADEVRVEVEEGVLEKQNADLQSWCDQYAQAVRDSLIGKPMAEADFAKRQFAKRYFLQQQRSLSESQGRLLYGNEINEELRKLKQSDLKKYL